MAFGCLVSGISGAYVPFEDGIANEEGREAEGTGGEGRGGEFAEDPDDLRCRETKRIMIGKCSIIAVT